MTFMLIRFAIIAAVIVALIIIGFTIAIIQKRNGHQDQVRQFVEPIVRNWANASPHRRGRGSVRANVTRTATRSVLNHLDRKNEEDRP